MRFALLALLLGGCEAWVPEARENASRHAFVGDTGCANPVRVVSLSGGLYSVIGCGRAIGYRVICDDGCRAYAVQGLEP